MNETNKSEGTKRDTDQQRYDDIINCPHHVSADHPHMSLSDRAAQFSPFSALPGYEEAIKETARLTDNKIELDENQKCTLDRKLDVLRKQIASQPEVTIRHFVGDLKKSGGSYVETTGNVRKINDYLHTVVLYDGLGISMDEIIEIEGNIFRCMESTSR